MRQTTAGILDCFLATEERGGGLDASLRDVDASLVDCPWMWLDQESEHLFLLIYSVKTRSTHGRIVVYVFPLLAFSPRLIGNRGSHVCRYWVDSVPRTA